MSIRYAHGDDQAALRRLAALDSAVVPEPPLLLAEVDGDLRAALSPVGRLVIADPFYPTAALVDLLRLRASQLGSGREQERGASRLMRPLRAARYPHIARPIL